MYMYNELNNCVSVWLLIIQNCSRLSRMSKLYLSLIVQARKEWRHITMNTTAYMHDRETRSTIIYTEYGSPDNHSNNPGLSDNSEMGDLIELIKLQFTK